MKIIQLTLAAVAMTLVAPVALSDIKIGQNFTFSGDARAGYFGSEREDRDNSESDSEEWRFRVRFGLKAKINQNTSFKIRFAGRYSTDDRNSNHFQIFRSSPSGDGLRRGQSTIDQFHLDFKVSSWKLRLGRQQTSYELKGVAKKSLDRNDSPNTDINWTDGVLATRQWGNGWNSDIILQYNAKEGATNVRRKPLNFTDSSSRISYFIRYGNKKKSGAFIQRALDITYLPSALRKDGSSTGRIEDYLVFLGRVALAWPVSNKGTKFVLGLEVAYAPETPTLAAKSLPGSGDSDGFATQITFNFVDIFPRHSMGLVVGRAGAGYLLSPDFRENNNLLELRYKWQLNKKQKFEARIRRRTEIKRLSGAADKRVDSDIYFRFTHKF